MDGALYVLLARKLRHQFSHVFTWNPTLHPHVMPKWRCRTVRNVERIERLAKVLVENKLSLFSNVLPHVAVVTSQTPYKQLTCPHHVIQLNTAAYSPQWGPIASTSSGKDRTWNKISYNLILEGLLNIILIILYYRTFIWPNRGPISTRINGYIFREMLCFVGGGIKR